MLPTEPSSETYQGDHCVYDVQRGHIEVVLQSFGYGHPPLGPEADRQDMTIDLRPWLRDPYLDPAMRAMTGLDQPVIDNVLAMDGALALVEHWSAALETLAGLGQRQNRLVRAAFGCVGGRHRSVVIATVIGNRLRAFGRGVDIEHLHITRSVLRRARPETTTS